MIIFFFSQPFTAKIVGLSVDRSVGRCSYTCLNGLLFFRVLFQCVHRLSGAGACGYNVFVLFKELSTTCTHRMCCAQLHNVHKKVSVCVLCDVLSTQLLACRIGTDDCSCINGELLQITFFPRVCCSVEINFTCVTETKFFNFLLRDAAKKSTLLLLFFLSLFIFSMCRHLTFLLYCVVCNVMSTLCLV